RGSDAALDAWVRLFATRLVLRVVSEAASIRLLGEPGAEDLDWVGQLWPRICGHVLPRIRGFRISPAYLEVLVEQMRQRATVEGVAEGGASHQPPADGPTHASDDADDLTAEHDHD